MSEFTEFMPHNRIDAQEVEARGGFAMVEYGPGEKNLIVAFFPKGVLNHAKSKNEGKPVYDSVDFIKIQHPGEKLNIVERPATDIDKRRFVNHWNSYLQGKQQIPDGVPLNLLFPTQPNIVETLKGYNIHTVEQLARLSEHGLQTIGLGAREWVNKAQTYIHHAEKGVNHHQFNKAIEERDKKIATLSRQLEEMNARMAQFISVSEQRPVAVPRAPKTVQSPNYSVGTLPNLADLQTEQINARATGETLPPPAQFSNSLEAPKRGRPKGSKNKPKES